MAYGHGLGAAFAAAAANLRKVMVCPDPLCAVEWIGPELPCWNCGSGGVQKYPEKKETV